MEQTIVLNERYDEFVSKYPLSELRSLPLERYTNGYKDSFIYDIEFGYVCLGKISGTSALIHGLYYSPKEQNGETEITYRKGHYVWKKTLGEDVETAYNTIINAIADVAEAASRNDWKEVDNNTIVQQLVKWKIAFLYSNKKLLPIYSRQMLDKAGYLSGIKNPENLTIGEIQERIIYVRGDRNIFEFYNDILQKVKNTQQYFWLNSNPKYWKVSEMVVGEEQNYTILNENGNKRVKAECFQKAKAGDLLIGYEATPTLKIAAILQITKPKDGESIWFKCIEKLAEPVSYNDIKMLPILQGHPIVKNPNGSMFELTEEQYNSIMNVVRRCNQVDDKYTRQDFLNEVFISEDDYENMKGLLELKKNIILQGVPGTGKTFCAKRLCYSLTGKRDDSKICMVQFHQNYSYEDFVMGYKPNGEGFELQTGIFYDFCKKAREDTSNNYYIIIDEINRGNLSKIFGELLMLIEKDYRGEKNAIHLAYKKDELFYVPKNLYIIGMMNTADRSLAMMDYALRRRFCFFDMKPCFDNEAFKLYTDNLKSDSFNNVIEAIKRLNQTIKDDDSLGEGFVIGHSYFCNQSSVEKRWLERVVKYEIEPMIREYWFDNKEKAETECSKLEDSL